MAANPNSKGIGPDLALIDCPVLVTERLVLRAPCDDDIPDIVQLAGNIRVAEMLRRMPHPYSEDDARHFLEAIAGADAAAVYAVTLAENGAFIGCAGLEECGAGLELGYWLGEPYWGRGYASEAASALVDLAFRASAVDLVHVSCRTVNPASRQVISKCGFRFAARGVMDSMVAGRVPVEHYVLDRSLWMDQRSGTAL